MKIIGDAFEGMAAEVDDAPRIKDRSDEVWNGKMENGLTTVGLGYELIRHPV